MIFLSLFLFILSSPFHSLVDSSWVILEHSLCATHPSAIWVREMPRPGLEQWSHILWPMQTSSVGYTYFGRHWAGWPMILYHSSGPKILSYMAFNSHIWKLSESTWPWINYCKHFPYSDLLFFLLVDIHDIF